MPAHRRQQHQDAFEFTTSFRNADNRSVSIEYSGGTLREFHLGKRPSGIYRNLSYQELCSNDKFCFIVDDGELASYIPPTGQLPFERGEKTREEQLDRFLELISTPQTTPFFFSQIGADLTKVGDFSKRGIVAGGQITINLEGTPLNEEMVNKTLDVKYLTFDFYEKFNCTSTTYVNTCGGGFFSQNSTLFVVLENNETLTFKGSYLIYNMAVDGYDFEGSETIIEATLQRRQQELEANANLARVCAFDLVKDIKDNGFGTVRYMGAEVEADQVVVSMAGEMTKLMLVDSTFNISDLIPRDGQSIETTLQYNIADTDAFYATISRTLNPLLKKVFDYWTAVPHLDPETREITCDFVPKNP